MAALNRRAAEVAVSYGARAATDITGFGLLGHASQLADAGRVSLRLAPRPGWFLPRVLELAAAGTVPGGLHKNRAFYRDRVGGTLPSEPMQLALFDPQTSGGLMIAVPGQGPGARGRAATAARLGGRGGRGDPAGSEGHRADLNRAAPPGVAGSRSCPAGGLAADEMVSPHTLMRIHCHFP
jgi:hypothetical protein